MIIISIETGNHRSEFPLNNPVGNEDYVMGRRPYPNDEDEDGYDPDDMLRCEINYYD